MELQKPVYRRFESDRPHTSQPRKLPGSSPSKPESGEGSGGTDTRRLNRSFFERPTPRVAKELLGTLLVRVIDTERLTGMIVETEAYRGADDPASHAYRGRTVRNSVMFGEGGHAYVYFSYGFHWCLNVSTEQSGTAGAVLIRAIEPIGGTERMRQNRGLQTDVHLTDGPGRLTRALEVGSAFNGEDLVASKRLFIERWRKPCAICSGPRVGIAKGLDRRWRFRIEGNHFVSRGFRSLVQNPLARNP